MLPTVAIAVSSLSLLKKIFFLLNPGGFRCDSRFGDGDVPDLPGLRFRLVTRPQSKDRYSDVEVAGIFVLAAIN
ncbi:hypothetical protein [Pseudomonas sp. FP1740]|uniref:hypothetical protein n=1 Tax=Pseudomonas sp. FP1740 TaxID=2954078 RepID=UPI0027362F09|nr:hypothetical protein [Pseudomonas sp. FP1740]WLG47807.1 hypothetical protein PSH69_14820 [Pseudomonas sp. FP1740]